MKIKCIKHKKPSMLTGNHMKTCMWMFIAALTGIVKNWKRTTCSSTDEWIQNMWYIYTRNKLLTHLYQEIQLKNIMLRKRSHTQKTTHCMLPFIWNVRNRQIYREQISNCLRLRVRIEINCKCAWEIFLERKNVLEMI